MATTTTKGYKKPQTGDFGSTFFPDLEFDIQRLNDHSHDGVNSILLTAASSQAVSELAGAAWTGPTGDGTYQKLVSLPASLIAAGLTYDKVAVSFRDGDGHILYLGSGEGTLPTNFYVYSNDNTLDVTVVYTT